MILLSALDRYNDRIGFSLSSPVPTAPSASSAAATSHASIMAIDVNQCGSMLTLHDEHVPDPIASSAIINNSDLAIPSTTAGCRYCLLGRRKGWKTHLSDDCRHHPHRDTRLANRAKYAKPSA